MRKSLGCRVLVGGFLSFDPTPGWYRAGAEAGVPTAQASLGSLLIENGAVAEGREWHTERTVREDLVMSKLVAGFPDGLRAVLEGKDSPHF